VTSDPADPTKPEAIRERPAQRPGVALLCHLDDSKSDRKWVRLRSNVTVIGRTEGTIRIPDDTLMSRRHAEIIRQPGKTGYRWGLVDLKSTNGTFVRIGKGLLVDGSELLIGKGRYCFDAGESLPEGGDSFSSPGPALVELSLNGPKRRFNLCLPEYWIGRDQQACAIARPDDPLVEARHARIYCDAADRWNIENNDSLTGVWLRITEPLELGDVCQFRVGDQRFLFRIA
jgi:pSer/pThr/pTyr-binding forkhead associated (FHA) protein